MVTGQLLVGSQGLRTLLRSNPEIVTLPVAGATTVKVTPLLGSPPTVTTTGPVVAPLGTGTTICVALQVVGVPGLPLKVTVLLPWVAPKWLPLIVTTVPTLPDVGEIELITGAKVTTMADDTVWL
jgi:hypothetical protein